MAAGRDISSNAQHPSLIKPYAIIIATAKKLVLHHLNAPVTTPGLLAAKAIWCRILNSLFIREAKKEHSCSIKWRDFVTVTLKEVIMLVIFRA